MTENVEKKFENFAGKLVVGGRGERAGVGHVLVEDDDERLDDAKNFSKTLLSFQYMR